MTVNKNEQRSVFDEFDVDENPQQEENRADKKILEGVRLFRQKNWDNALIEFLTVKTQDFTSEEKVELAYYLGLCYTKLERYEEALSYLEQVVIANMDFLRVYQCRMTLAFIYVKTDRIKMAEYELKRLQDIGLESPLLFNALGYASWVQKQYKTAVEFYEKALDMEPENPTALNCLGYILADTAMDIMRALRLIRRAVDYKPQNPAYLDSLGWAYYKSGNATEAKIWLRRALDLAPKSQPVCEAEIKRHYKIVTGEEA